MPVKMYTPSPVPTTEELMSNITAIVKEEHIKLIKWTPARLVKLKKYKRGLNVVNHPRSVKVSFETNEHEYVHVEFK